MRFAVRLLGSAMLVWLPWTTVAAQPAQVQVTGVVRDASGAGVPRLTGGDAVRIATGADVDVALRPALLLEQDGTLLGRWLVD